MHELVPEDVAGLGERARRGQHHAPLLALGHASRSLAEALDHVGLAEVRAARVEHDRLAASERLAEEGREPRAPALGEARHLADLRLFLRVVVDVEVLGLQDLEIEVAVLDLVLSEVLGLGGRAEENRQAGRESKPNTPNTRTHRRITTGPHKAR